MKKLALLLFTVLCLCACSAQADADHGPIDTMLSSVIHNSYPDYQLFDYAPIGKDNTEYILLARDSANKPIIMIVNTEQHATDIEFCNTSIMEGIPLDKYTVQMMDHLLDGHPSVEYKNPDSQEFLYVLWCKNTDGRWYVTEAQFGDEWNDFYWFRYNDRDKKIHVYLTGNELMALPDESINRSAEEFDSEEAREYLRSVLIPFFTDHEAVVYDRTADECYNSAWPMSGADFDDLLTNLTDRIASRQMYSVTGTVKCVIPGTSSKAVFEINDSWVPFSVLISNASNMEWTEGSTYRVYAEAYAYSETESMPWLLAGYTFSK